MTTTGLHRQTAPYSDLFTDSNPHTFANSRNAAFAPITLFVQDVVGRFLSSNGAAVTILEPSEFFEFPIPLPLPEGLNFVSSQCRESRRPRGTPRRILKIIHIVVDFQPLGG